MPIIRKMTIAMFICFIAGWALGGFAVYSYLALLSRGDAFQEELENDEPAEMLDNRQAA